MPSRRSRSEQERAEARRRSRYASQGKEPLPGDEPRADAKTPAPAAQPGLFSRIFPPAPPLPGKGDPLAGFRYTGRFPGIAAGAWLLAHHPLAWGVPAVGWAVLQLALFLVSRQNIAAFAITLAQYALLIGSGWVGWWRPWLFGAAAGVFGTFLYALIAGIVTFQSGEGSTVALGIIGSLSALTLLYGLVGAFAGFYGGYLRRRMAPPQPTKGKRR